MCNDFNDQLSNSIIYHNLYRLNKIGDLYEEDQILNWLMTQKDPGGDVIEDIEGQRLIDLIEQSGSMAVYFCKFKYVHSSKKKGTFEYYLLGRKINK